MRGHNPNPFIVLITIALFACVAGQGRAQSGTKPSTFAALLEKFKSMPGLEARYKEEKHVALLSQPLKSRGTLYFNPPSSLLLQADWPDHIDTLITPQVVQRRSAGNTQTIDLSMRKDVQPFVVSMLWLFSGDHKALQQAYTIQFKPAASATSDWHATLTPKTAPHNQFINSLVLTGQGWAVSQINVNERSGDRSITTVIKANPARRFGRQETSRLFGLQSHDGI